MDEQYRIGIVGVGQLGSRYLQGLMRSSVHLAIEAVEPNEIARSIAMVRIGELTASHLITLRFLDSIDQMSQGLDVVIIATNSDVRFQIVQQLVSRSISKKLILEKVLFGRSSEYYQAQSLFEKHRCEVWVNHPNRSFPFYKRIKSLVTQSEHISMNVMGGGWGLACNGLHFIDTLSYLTNFHELSISVDNLNSEIIAAKRMGFFEVTGLLTGRLGNARFSLHCIEEVSPLTVSISTNRVAYRIDEVNGVYEVSQYPDWKWERFSEKIIYFQSETTADLVERLFVYGNCDLPKYESAMMLHVPFIESLQKHINMNVPVPFEYCPIT